MFVNIPNGTKTSNNSIPKSRRIIGINDAIVIGVIEYKIPLLVNEEGISGKFCQRFEIQYLSFSTKEGFF